MFFIFFVKTGFLYSQNRTIAGKILANFEIPEGMHICNATKDLYSISNADGEFEMEAEINDTLIITGVSIRVFKTVINEKSYLTGKIVANVERKVFNLNEIIVEGNRQDFFIENYYSKSIMKISPAEKKLNNAKKGINGIINTLNGSLKYRVKELEKETRNLLVEDIRGKYEEEYFNDLLEVPCEYINGFLNYCIDDMEVVDSFKRKRLNLFEFLLINKSKEYKKLISH